MNSVTGKRKYNLHLHHFKKIHIHQVLGFLNTNQIDGLDDVLAGTAPPTVIGVFPLVFDVSGEFGEHIYACCVGFRMFGGQSGVASVKGTKGRSAENICHRRSVQRCPLPWRG